MAPDVAIAITRLEDRRLRRRVSRGDFGPLADLDLTPEEKVLILAGYQAAAA